MRDADVVVVGGGLIGSATAWWLARSGRDVVLLEQFEAGHDRGSSHGDVRIFRFAYPQRDYVDLARRALELWRELEADSGETLLDITGGTDFGYEPSVQAVAACLAAAGEPGQWMQPGEASERFAGMRFTGPVLFHPQGGRCWADRSVAALHREASRHGAELRFNQAVTALDGNDETARVRTASGEEYRARAVVVAAGAWVAKLVGAMVELPPLRVTREQPVHFAARDDAALWPSFIEHAADASFTTYGLGAPGVEVKMGEHMVGPVVDPDSAAVVDAAAVARAVAHAKRFLPGVDPAPVKVETCLYTNTANEDFIIDRRGPLTIASPCSGHGFKFGPATGELVARVALGETEAPARFRL